MSISQDHNTSTIVCREVFDETSHPSNEEILDYAKRLGIDPDSEAHLLPLAREGLMAALPKGWVPCFHEASGAWYYYQSSTRTTAWEHPLDAVYKELVQQARAGVRQMSLEEDSKTTAKELESHEEEATLPNEGGGGGGGGEGEEGTTAPKETTTLLKTPTKIPAKLAPLKRLDKTQDAARRRKTSSTEKLHSRRGSDSRSSAGEHVSILSTDRAARDYTNLKFQDPKFYECPKLLESDATETEAAAAAGDNSDANDATPSKRELDLKEVLKRSESLSPRYEKDWEQLSSKFSSEENIIDIDKLSASTLARSERTEKFDKEKHPSQLGQQKELTLSGGGSMFLKSNRSRDTTPSQDSAKLEDFKVYAIADESTNVVVGDRPKSILREKQCEDDDRPVDEERKSVRFDLERKVDIKFPDSGSEDEWNSGETSEEQLNTGISAIVVNRITGSVLSASAESSVLREYNKRECESESRKVSPPSGRPQAPIARSTKIKRFVVRNVSENEHRSQMAREKLTSQSSSSLDLPSPGKFDRVKKIDVTSKSETDSVSQTRNSDTEDVGKNSSITENSRHVGKSKLAHSRSFEDARMNMTREHEREMEMMKKEFEEKLSMAKREFEEKFLAERASLQKDLEERLSELKREMAEKEEEEIQKLIAEMDEARTENLKKVRAELEVCYEKERQEILGNLKSELDERKRELLELRNQEMVKLEDEHERDLGEEKLAKLNEFELNKRHGERMEALKKELEKEFDELRSELRMQQREKITKITEDHEKCLAEILRDFQIDEDLARKVYKQRLEEIRADFSRDMENEARKQTERALQQENIDFEKLRCEKRLLQDKYMALKEKYVKLKNDVRLAVERRSKRKEAYATASETERSKTERTESSEQNTPLRNTHSTSSQAQGSSKGKRQESKASTKEDRSQNETEESRSGRTSAGFPRATASSKFESDDTTTASETNANTMRRRKSFARKQISMPSTSTASNNNSNNNNNNNNNSSLENPVENIRKQLEKLEHLGDQLPSNETAYTLRYPFQDKAPANASSELEFFRHRIHVERDSVRRAREALRQQRSVFQDRKRAWKQRSARATLEQLVQEERELSDMEVSLHRTRSLLGEKVIHLRHLEQSLERVSNAKRSETDAASTKNDELTLSDMSSASSGFSSTDLGTDTFVDKPDHYQESTEIIASLENLNSEIREIWGVLNKRQDNNVPPPPPPTLMYSYLRWLRFHHLTAQQSNVQGSFGTPNIQSNILSQLTATQAPTTTTQNIIAQYGPNSGFTTSVGTVERSSSSYLVERTRNLRDWLRQARIESTDMVGPGQATL